jgi:hypothetical protein
MGMAYSVRSGIFTISLLLWIGTGSEFAHGQAIPIANASFETPSVRPGVTTIGGIPGWTMSASNGANVIAGVTNRPASSFTPPTDGSQLGYLSMTAPPGQQPPPFVDLSQTLSSTLSASTNYALSIDVYTLTGGCPSSTCDGPFLGVIAGNCSLMNSQLSRGNNYFLFSSPAAPSPCIGQPLTIDIRIILTNFIALPYFFDNLSLGAFPTTPFPILHGAFGSFGPIIGEAARLKAFCDGSVMPVADCQATLEFHDIQGVLLSQQNLMLRPGTSGFLDLRSVEPAVGGRDPHQGPSEVVPVWFLQSGHAVMSLDMFGEDMRISHFINWGDDFGPALGNLDSGPVTLSRGQSGRLKAFCDGSVRTRCNVNFAFSDASGRMLKQSSMTLAPGKAGFLDISFEETGAIGRTVEIRPSLMVGEGPAVGGFALLDETGHTITQTLPGSIISAVR